MHPTLLAAALALSFLPAPPAAAAPQKAAPVTSQLPRNAAPRHYDVHLVPDAAAGTFTGTVTITFEVLAPTRTLVLNAAGLAFQRVALHAPGGAVQSAPAVVDAGAQTASFTFAHTLARGSYRLVLDYSGAIGTQASGLFSLDYDTDAGKRRALYTQFENSDARRMLPSWDEPFYKASFTLSADVPADQLAVSNMPAVSRSAVPGAPQRMRVRFAATPAMSTYLLFFGVGDFERASVRAEGTELGVVTRKGSGAQAAYVLAASSALLKEYNDYFGVRYPLPKLDNVAAPGSNPFFGAMENWGAIFTFERAMLLDASSSQKDRESVFSTAAHEMAHQWFGDLVTMAWWDELWLNEGFASWMQSRMSARMHPEWETALEAVNVRDKAMQRDSVVTTHPVVQHVETVDQASQAFDSITYSKGASVIRMLEDYVGEQPWRDGVRAYLRKHAYGNTVSNDLWTSIESASGKPLQAIAHDFTLQPGVPLIEVGAARCEDGASTVQLTQGEYSRDQPQRASLRWRVPVVARALGAAAPARTVVSGGRATLRVPGCAPVVVNAGQNGYFRTLYTAPAFAALAGRFAELAPIDQLGLLADSWALGLAGRQDPGDFLDLAAATPLTANVRVWDKLAGVLGAIDALYGKDAARRQRFAAFAGARLAPMLAQVGWDARTGEADNVATLRATLIQTLGALGHADTLAQVRQRYAHMQAHPQTPDSLEGPLREVMALHADAAIWDSLHAAARAEKSPVARQRQYLLLASAADPALARRALDLALGDEPGITTGAAMLTQVAQHHPDMAFDVATADLARIDERVDESSRSRFVAMLAAPSADAAMPAKLRAYAEAHLAPGSRRDAETAMADIADRIKVRSARLPAIDAWLARHAP